MSGIVTKQAFAQCETPVPAKCLADLDNDCQVTSADLAIVLADFGCQTGCCIGDVDLDGKTGESDLGAVLSELDNCTGLRVLPLIVWVDDPHDPNDPVPLPVGHRGAAFADFDADDWPDATLFVDGVRRLYWNDHTAVPSRWIQGCMIDALGFDPNGYSASAADYNNDGYPDYVNEPHNNPAFPPSVETLYFLVNTGCRKQCGFAGCTSCTSSQVNYVWATPCLGIGGGFSDEQTETACFGDADGDGDLELFLPGYKTPQHSAATGNHFFRNTSTVVCTSLDSPCDPNAPRVYSLVESASAAGLASPVSNDPPEGAQFLDYDQDGDLDLAFQHAIYQNLTTQLDSPAFRTLQSEVGIQPFAGRDEGLLLIDFDMDGDLDLFRQSFGGATFVNRGRGDGSFEAEINPIFTSGWGLSAADWDNDGDLDLTRGGHWYRNATVEREAQPCQNPMLCWFQRLQCLADANCEIPNGIVSWCDVDRDGDLDAARPDFANVALSRFYQNRLYTNGTGPGSCDESRKRYINVRPVRPVGDPNGPPPLPAGREFSENELGSRVELVLRNSPSKLRRIQHTSSASGYINQNEYLLHFGVPVDPSPGNSSEDWHFDLFVDFVDAADTVGETLWRVDWTVNPKLYDINLAALYPTLDPNTFGRIVTVYRDGRVRYGGHLFEPNEPGAPTVRMHTLGGPIRLPAQSSPLPFPVASNVMAGIRFTKTANT
ncbi:MAG TPA: VCBS repeat-containing protein, partial [Methylomirabilota bacterium]|nr:VCBS repeat-containing protein [Methylomirabilota bacterium]